MTIIPDDAGTTGPPRDVSERIEASGERAEDMTRRFAAAVAGALEGFVEAMERYDVKGEADEALHEAGAVSRAAATEGRTQAQTPEMRQLGSQIQNAGHAVGERTRETSDNLRTSAQHARENVQHRVERARETARHAKEEVKVRADAVAESGRRAKHAPRRVGRELGEAFQSWKTGLMTAVGMWALLVVFSAIALVVVTIALVVGLNELIGDPAGTFVVAVAYLVIAGIAWAVARGARSKASNESRQHVENAREEVRSVARPTREAFSRGRPGA